MQKKMDIKKASTLITMAFTVGKVGVAIVSLFNVIELSDRKIDKLLKADLGCGISALQSAQNAQNERNQQTQLEAAREYFRKATRCESDIRLADAYLGLAFCHYHLGDKKNSLTSLTQILTITRLSYPTRRKFKGAAGAGAGFLVSTGTIMALGGMLLYTLGPLWPIAILIWDPPLWPIYVTSLTGGIVGYMHKGKLANIQLAVHKYLEDGGYLNKNEFAQLKSSLLKYVDSGRKEGYHTPFRDYLESQKLFHSKDI